VLVIVVHLLATLALGRLLTTATAGPRRADDEAFRRVAATAR
jgi:hypothetical protein